MVDSPAIVGIGASFVGLLHCCDCLLTIAVNAHKAVGLDPGRGTANAPAGNEKEPNVIHDERANGVMFVPNAFEQADRTLPARVLKVACGVEFGLRHGRPPSSTTTASLPTVLPFLSRSRFGLAPYRLAIVLFDSNSKRYGAGSRPRQDDWLAQSKLALDPDHSSCSNQPQAEPEVGPKPKSLAHPGISTNRKNRHDPAMPRRRAARRLWWLCCPHTPDADEPITPEAAHAIGVDAYLYFYPLVTMDITRKQSVNIEPGKEFGKGPMNMFVNVPAYPPADYKVVVRSELRHALFHRVAGPHQGGSGRLRTGHGRAVLPPADARHVVGRLRVARLADDRHQGGQFPRHPARLERDGPGGVHATRGPDTVYLGHRPHQDGRCGGLPRGPQDSGGLQSHAALTLGQDTRAGDGDD